MLVMKNKVLDKWLIFACLCFSLRSNGAKCPASSGCRCRKTRSSFYQVTCLGKYPKMELLEMTNVSKILLRGIQVNNDSNLEFLRNATDMASFSIVRGWIKVFDWDWLPDSCRKFSLSLPTSPTYFVSKPNSTTTCNVRTTLNVTKIFLNGDAASQFPACLPDRVSILSLIRFPLHSFQRKFSHKRIKWPGMLRTLLLKQSSLADFGDHVFRHAPPTVKNVWISNSLVRLRQLPNNFPRSLSSLFVTGSGLNETGAIFKNLKNLTKISFIRNKLTTVPLGFPASLVRLMLDYNQIASAPATAWQGLDNLLYLAMKHNKLTYIPESLPASLQVIDLANNLVEYCSPSAFAHIKNLITLKLSYNRLLNMPVNLPHTMIHLSLSNNRIALVRSKASYNFCNKCRFIDLSDNPWVCDYDFVSMLLWLETHVDMTKYSVKLRGKCSYLRKITSSVDLLHISNYMRYLATSQFKNCTYNVKTLHCIDLNLTDTPSNPPNGLQRLEVSLNPRLMHIPDSIYLNQSKLTHLILENNSLEQFPRGLPTSLQHLSLSFNRIEAITHLDQPTLNNLTKLLRLQLEGNRITSLYNYQLLPLKSLVWLNLVGNRIHCDCSVQSLVIYFTDVIMLTRRFLDVSFLTPRCVTPKNLEGRPITELTGVFDYAYKCIPARCFWNKSKAVLDCSLEAQSGPRQTEVLPLDPTKAPYIPYSTYWKALNLSGLSLTSKQVQLQNLTRLEILDLSGNQLESMPVNVPSSLHRINLQGNKISTLVDPTFARKYLPQLKELNLRDNNIKSIRSDQIQLFRVVDRVLLEGNPLQCDCTLRPFIVWFQTNNNSLTYLDQKKLRCFGPPTVAKQNLKDLKEAFCPEPDLTGVIAGCAAAAVLLLMIFLSVILFLYLRRKRRHRDDIVMGFRSLLQEETTKAESKIALGTRPDEYKYDAFVSYSNKNEQFLFDIIEELEQKRKRKLCLHARDFTPGRGIADNIAECIGLSRRVILVVSRDYVKSDWCQYEVLVTLARIHSTRNGRLLVPLVIENNADHIAVTEELQTIFATHPGIDAPEPQEGAQGWNKFWEKVDAALG